MLAYRIYDKNLIREKMDELFDKVEDCKINSITLFTKYTFVKQANALLDNMHKDETYYLSNLMSNFFTELIEIAGESILEIDIKSMTDRFEFRLLDNRLDTSIIYNNIENTVKEMREILDKKIMNVMKRNDLFALYGVDDLLEDTSMVIDEVKNSKAGVVILATTNKLLVARNGRNV